MTKQTKIFFSVVLSCTMLLLLFVPCFAYSYTLYSGDSITYTDKYDSSHQYNFPSSLTSSDQTITYPCDASIELSGDVYSVDSIILEVNYETYQVGTILYDVFMYLHIPSLPDGYQNYPIIYNIYNSDGSGFHFSGSADGVGYLSFNSDFSYDDTLNYILTNNDVFTIDRTYEGNPFLDIMNMVIEALDVPLFGSFSLWDMLTTLCGLFAVVWLLKLLAGG